MNWVVRIIFTALSVFRLSQLVSVDSGPAFLILKFRKSIKDPNWRELFSCTYCTGILFSLPAAWFLYHPNDVVDAIITVFGIAGAHAFLVGVGGRTNADYLEE